MAPTGTSPAQSRGVEFMAARRASSGAGASSSGAGSGGLAAAAAAAARQSTSLRGSRLARSVQPGSCRYDSLDSLQHLSSDGMMRPWLPSYANVGRIMTTPVPGDARMCYITVYRLCVPQWYKVFEVRAGRMNARRAEPPSAAPASLAEEGSVPSPSSSADADSFSIPFLDIDSYPYRRIDEPVGCSGSGRAAGSSARAGRDVFATTFPPHPASPAGAGPALKAALSLTPDSRQGRLSLWRDSEDASHLRLLWTPGDSAPPGTASLFATAADAWAAETAAAELDLCVDRACSFRGAGVQDQVSSTRTAALLCRLLGGSTCRLRCLTLWCRLTFVAVAWL